MIDVSLNVFMDMKSFDKKRLIRSADAAFVEVKDRMVINSEVQAIIAEIDGSEYAGGTNITTRYGETIDMEYLSTSCKAALLTRTLSHAVINGVEAGNNAILCMLRFRTGNLFLPVIPNVYVDFPVDVVLHKGGKSKHYATALRLAEGMLNG